MATTVFDLLARVSADVSPFNTAFDSTSDSVESSLSSIYQSARRWLGAGGVAGTFMRLRQRRMSSTKSSLIFLQSQNYRSKR